MIDALAEGVVAFDEKGRLLYANPPARRLLERQAEVKQELYVSFTSGEYTLADRERRAILDMLASTRGKLAETARRLGISRTTLWRRLRAYGLGDGNGNDEVHG